MRKVIGAVAVVFGFVGIASAQQISTRVELNAILSSGYEYTDAFEGYNIGVGGSDNTNLTSLNSTSIVNGQGPGLVGPGVTYSTYDTGFTGEQDFLFWNGPGYFGGASKNIESGQQGIEFTYTLNVNAMGVDLSDFQGFGDTYTAYVYNGINLVGTSSGTLSGPTPTFFGWQNAGGITSVILVDSVNYWSPIVDEHSFGFAPTPEPASMAALTLGSLALLRRRRKA